MKLAQVCANSEFQLLNDIIGLLENKPAVERT